MGIFKLLMQNITTNQNDIYYSIPKTRKLEIKIIQGDITKVEVDVIVNAANTSLLGGGGVDGAIHRAGGSEILEECKQIRNKQGGCKVGEAVITNAGKLKAKKVIHTVGPTWNNGNSDEEEKLKNCYINSIRIAEEYKFNSIAFPNISTGIYRFPKALAAKIAFETIKNHKYKSINEIVFVCFDIENLSLYTELNSND